MPTWLINFLGGPIIQKLLDFIPDPAERARQEFELQKAMMDEAAKAEADQRDINKQEAASGSVFVAGWRPGAGWLCVFVMAWSWVIAPFLSWTIAVYAAFKTGGAIPPIPVVGGDDSQTLLYALLGVAGLRTADKAVPHLAAAIGKK